MVDPGLRRDDYEEKAMRENRVKRIVTAGGLALGPHTGGIADPQIVEIIGLAGFDAAFIDMEHTSFDLRDIQLMVMAAERVGITSIVRPSPTTSTRAASPPRCSDRRSRAGARRGHRISAA